MLFYRILNTFHLIWCFLSSGMKNFFNEVGILLARTLLKLDFFAARKCCLKYHRKESKIHLYRWPSTRLNKNMSFKYLNQYIFCYINPNFQPNSFRRSFMVISKILWFCLIFIYFETYFNDYLKTYFKYYLK